MAEETKTYVFGNDTPSYAGGWGGFGNFGNDIGGLISIIVIGKTTCPAEFQSTFDHEKGHLAMHIAEFENIDVFSEQYQYLVGDIGKQMFKVAKLFMCDCGQDRLKSLIEY